MTTFHLIINNILKIGNNNFFTNIENIDNTIRNYFAFNMIKDDTLPLYKIKFNFLKKGLESFMIKGNKEEEFIRYFNIIQHVYNVLNSFAYRYKIRKSPIVVKTDMILNELHENEKNVICIYQENSRYLFKITDLLKIINTSLTNSDNFFSNPLCIKNPYNNLPFGKNILYYIYYFIKRENIYFNIIHSELFFKFHECNFNIINFLDKYEYLLREKIIENYVKNTPTDIINDNINMMLSFYNSNNFKKKIIIHAKFPKNKIIEIFKPYLILYMNSNLSLIPSQKYKSSCILEEKLKRFQEFNPFFGRAKINFKKKYINGKVKIVEEKISFNDNHINFNEYNNDSFLNDHLS